MPPAMTLRRPLLGALLAAGAGGCSVLPDRPYIETKRYPLDPRRPGPPRRSGRTKVLQVRLTRAAPGLDQRGLRTLRPDGTESVDFYNEWVAPPAELVEEAVRRWLSASGLFAGVTTPGSRARSDLVLETELTALQADPQSRIARAALSALLIADPGGGAPTRVLTQITPSGTAPLPVDVRGETTPEAAAEAMSQALAGALARLEEALVRYA